MLVILFIDLVSDLMQATDPATAMQFKLLATICVIVVLSKRR